MLDHFEACNNIYTINDFHEVAINLFIT
jgi:hypothetical protein